MTQVRRMGQWMYPIDERILEHLAEESWASPATMASETEFQQLSADAEYIDQRCNLLAERELVVPVLRDSSMYEISTWGLAYLRGDLDARHLQRWNPGHA